MSDLSEVLTPEEYDTLVALHEKADRLVLDRYKDYLKATKGYGPDRYDTITYISYAARGDRPGRDPSGRFDIEILYPDRYDRGLTGTLLPSSILWDPAGAIGKTLEAIEAERVEQARLEAEAEEERRASQERAERAHIAKLAKKYGYVKKETK